jgi:hypothetical protein
MPDSSALDYFDNMHVCRIIGAGSGSSGSHGHLIISLFHALEYCYTLALFFLASVVLLILETKNTYLKHVVPKSLMNIF